MKKVLTLLLFAGLITGTALAQGVDRDVDVFPEQVSIEHTEAVKLYSQKYASLGHFISGHGSLINSILQGDQIAIITQIGISNTANITQFGSNNTASIFQSGIGNTAEMYVDGVGNNTSTVQFGYKNSAYLSVDANNNTLSLLQFGSFNTFDRKFETNGFEDRFKQIGIGLNMTIQGSNNIPITVEQTGNNMGILIENN